MKVYYLIYMLRKKFNEIITSIAENLRAIIDGHFFSTTLQTQLSILQILRSLLSRMDAIDNRLRARESLDKKALDMIVSYVTSVEHETSDAALLEQKVIDHLESLLRHSGVSDMLAKGTQMDFNASNASILLVEFLFPWLKEKTVINVGGNQENFVEAMLRIGFKKIVRFESNFENLLPAHAGILKIDDGTLHGQILQTLPIENKYEIICCDFKNKIDSEESETGSIISCLREMNYPFSICLICHADGRLEFSANISPYLGEAKGSILCFRKGALFEKAYAFMSAQLPMHLICRQSPN